MTIFNILIYTDTICPWCYIGEKNLDRAIALYQRTYPGGSQDEFKFNYRPYYLDKDAPIPGMPMKERIAQKNGAEMARGIITRLERTGRACGIAFSFQGRIGNTKDSHRLLYFAAQKSPGAQKALIERLFGDLFEGSSDISCRADLIRAATATGLVQEEVEAFFESQDGSAEVDHMAAEARNAGIRAVPVIEINGIRTEGADDPSEFFEILVKARTSATTLDSTE